MTNQQSECLVNQELVAGIPTWIWRGVLEKQVWQKIFFSPHQFMQDIIIILFLLSLLAGMTLSGQLDSVFREYGYHLATTSYFISHDQQKIKSMFERIRQLGDDGGYPKACAQFHIKNIRDLTTGELVALSIL